MDKQYGSINSIIEEQGEQIKKLQAENKILREAVEFYADRNVWKDSRTLGIVDSDLTDKGGVRAREALTKVNDKEVKLDFKGGFVHVSVKLCDVRSGDVVWAASGSKSIFGIADSHSAAIHLERLLRDMFKTFPPVK